MNPFPQFGVVPIKGWRNTLTEFDLMTIWISWQLRFSGNMGHMVFWIWRQFGGWHFGLSNGYGFVFEL